MKNFFLICMAVAGLVLASCGNSYNKVLIDDDFSGYPLGLFSPCVGPELEYHFIVDKFPEGNWRQACFVDRVSDTCYRLVEVDGTKVMAQEYAPTGRKAHYSHPIMIAGTEFWQDYTLSCTLTPTDGREQTGVVFRYRNSRQYYYFGFENKKDFENKVVAYRVDHAPGFEQATEDVMAEGDFACEAGKTYTLSVTATGDRFEMSVDGVKVLEFTDDLYKAGKVGFFADRPCYFSRVTVTTSGKEVRRIAAEQKAKDDGEAALQAANPKPVLWKKFSTKGFGTGRNVRFGDVNNDGKIDIVFGQVHRDAAGPDKGKVFIYLTAVTTDGEILWQRGEQSSEELNSNTSGNDTAFQIADINGDGRSELIYVYGDYLIIADAATGETLKQTKTPLDPAPGQRREIMSYRFMLCNVSGKDAPQDIAIKDKYDQVWLYNNDLKLLWTAKCNAGHYPYAYDVDGDGRDEVMVGYTLFSPDGKVLWTWDGQVKDHCDGVAIVNGRKDDPSWSAKVYNAASNDGFIVADAKTGVIEKHHSVGHVQNPVMLNLRDDMPGLEVASINFWGNQGIIHFYDYQGNIYHSFEPINSGSMMLPVNWTGGTEEFILHNPHIRYGGMYDGWGRKAVAFPDDGHPYLCCAALNLTGDVRDELVVWDLENMWIYTQDNSPLDDATLYHPDRTPLHNSSNYQMLVSQ